MTEDEARRWLRAEFGVAAEQRLAHYVDLLLIEAERQSLIARSTFSSVWSRHIADSAQLVSLAPAEALWVDIGSGGGLPGVVVAILRPAPLLMVEPRRMRAEFLQRVVDDLQLGNATVARSNIQALQEQAAVVSARAVASLPELMAWTHGIVSRGTKFIFPRGETASDDLAKLRQAWHGSFHVEPSLTNPRAGIVIATDVRPK